ncbi:MAG: type II secretion system F family protein [Moorellaceae bacterium]
MFLGIDIFYLRLVASIGAGMAVVGVAWLMADRAATSRAGMASALSEKFNQIAVPRLSPRVAAAAVILFLLGTILFRNPVPAFALAAFGILVPDQLRYAAQRRHQEKVMEQMTSAIRLFAAEYAVAPQLGRCLAVVGQHVHDPVGAAFRKAYVSLAVGERPDDVLDNLARDLNSSYGYMFVHLLRAAGSQGQRVIPLFHELASRVTTGQQLSKLNRSEVSGDRIGGFLLSMLPLPLYFLLQWWMPETHVFFTSTAAGRVIITISLLSALGWFFVDRVVNEI